MNSRSTNDPGSRSARKKYPLRRGAPANRKRDVLLRFDPPMVFSVLIVGALLAGLFVFSERGRSTTDARSPPGAARVTSASEEQLS
jgi:hypothetical protein